MLFAHGFQTLMFKSSSFFTCKSDHVCAAPVTRVYTKFKNYSDPWFKGLVTAQNFESVWENPAPEAKYSRIYTVVI